VIRADQINASGIITNQIISHILEDSLIIVDLTDYNPNVFYELAISHAYDKPVIMIISKTQKLPFDVSRTRVVELEDTLKGTK
jgi:hypothetical protein